MTDSDSSRFLNMSAGQQSAVTQAAEEAHKLAMSAHLYLQQLKEGSPRFETWFGEYNSASYSKVAKTFYLLTGGEHRKKISEFTYSLDRRDSQHEFGYVDPNRYGEINLYPNFFRYSQLQPGMLVQLASEFAITGATQLLAFDSDPCKELAQKDPGKAIANADSYRLFALAPELDS
ncbi:M35 family metallo-endopeptidase [Kitasatospora sp. NPDC004799]|uniref:M35 family metallo-endopeptidase n=1 Tax=Kitasatospora sp. NPDC004799 TaxID=3154460 RepID=UPI0033BA0B36